MKKNLSVAAIGSILLFLLLRWQGSALKTPATPRGIIDLELANTQQKLHDALVGWDVSTVKMNIWLDFLFIIAYTLFFSLAARACAERWPGGTMPKKAGFFFAKLAFLAGLLDVIENLFMLRSIQGNFSDVSLQTTFYCASIKFLIAAVILVYLVASLPFVLRKK